MLKLTYMDCFFLTFIQNYLSKRFEVLGKVDEDDDPGECQRHDEMRLQFGQCVRRFVPFQDFVEPKILSRVPFVCVVGVNA